MITFTALVSRPFLFLPSFLPLLRLVARQRREKSIYRIMYKRQS